MKQVRNRVNVHLICDQKKLATTLTSPTFREARIVNEDLTMVRRDRKQVTISVGFVILELWKPIM